MSKPCDHPIRWARGFGWGTWRAFWRLMFPPNKPMIGYEVLEIRPRGWPWSLALWPWWKLRRLNWAIRGPL